MRTKGELVFLIMALLSFSIHPLAIGEGMINKKYDGSGKAIADQSKVSHGAVGGGGSGGQPAASGGDNGGTHSPGGGGATPAYASGGGANIHHNHHGGGNSSSTTGLATLVITIFACVLLCISNKYW